VAKLVFGLGKSGEAVRAFLNVHNIPTLVFDDSKHTDLPVLNEIDECFISPGISPSHRLVKLLREANIPIFSELDLASRYFKGKIIAITGTNGKSTVTKMIEHIYLKHSKRAIACGNIGLPFISVCEQNYDIACVELSSYQIEWSKEFRPDVVVLTSLSFDHIERHKTLDNYHQIKLSLNAPYICAQSIQARIKELRAPAKIDYVVGDCTYFASKHDNFNASLAYTAAAKDLPIRKDELNDYIGLEHRFEIFMTHENLKFINDSKSTNLESVESALESLTRSCVLLCGGQGKGENFGQLLKHKDKVAKLFTFGRDARKIAQELIELNPLSFPSLKELLEKLDPLGHKRDILFSPGCASFDEFKDFEDRGRFFKDSVRTKLAQISEPP
jgi:UDP-N-acetylmuramoylalanine--D-glutamate ligase